MIQERFTCVKCKGQFAGSPALRNATGCYCESCQDILVERMRSGAKRYADEQRGICPWCGDQITNANRQRRDGEDSNVCAPCAKNRTWLLNCIRKTDRVAKYVARIEDREKDARRANQARAVRQVVIAQAITSQPDSRDDRIARLEAMIEKLTNALGGPP